MIRFCLVSHFSTGPRSTKSTNIAATLNQFEGTVTKFLECLLLFFFIFSFFAAAGSFTIIGRAEKPSKKVVLAGLAGLAISRYIWPHARHMYVIVGMPIIKLWGDIDNIHVDNPKYANAYNPTPMHVRHTQDAADGCMSFHTIVSPKPIRSRRRGPQSPSPCTTDTMATSPQSRRPL